MTMLTRRSFLSVIPTAAALQFAGARSGFAGNGFEGKSMTYIVATKPGGGYDTMGRLVAKYLQKHLPGLEVRVKNVPGGSHVVGALEICNAAPDGLTIGTFNTGLIYAQLLGELPAPLDLTKLSWIGKAALETRVLVVGAATPFRTVADLRSAGRAIRLVSSGMKGASYYETRMLGRALDFPVEIIPGFEGREGELSVMRGEVDGLFASGSALAPFLRNGFGRAVVQVGGSSAEGVPQAADFATGAQAQMLIALIGSQSHLARLTAGPPAMEPERLAALRTAYMAMFKDPGFIDESSRLELPLAPLDGAEVAKAVNAALSLPPAQVESLRELLTT